MAKMPSEEHIRKEADLEGESYEHERAEYEEGARKRKKRKSGGACEGEKSPMRLDRPGRARGGKLSSAERQKMPSSEFALPGHGIGPKGKGSGSYPIPDASHARNALARVSQHGSSSEKARVRSAVHRKFPEIGQSKD